MAGDLFVRNMDWPGAEELVARLRKTIDPALLNDGDESPELVAAQQQMQAMQAEMSQMAAMLQNVEQSIENREVEIKEFDAKVKAYEAETRRLAAVQNSMQPEQIQDIVMGTIAGMITSGDLVAEMPGQELMQEPVQETIQEPIQPGVMQ